MSNDNCPDCRGAMELEEVEVMSESLYGEINELERIYYKCPKCKAEFDQEDIDE